MLCWVTQRSRRCGRQRAPNATVACGRGAANSGAPPLGLAPPSERQAAGGRDEARWRCRPPTHGIDAGRQKGGQRPRSARERGRRTGLLPSMVIAAVPATDLQHGWADEADEVADGRQRRPQHAAPRPRRDMPRRSGEHQARPAGLFRCAARWRRKRPARRTSRVGPALAPIRRVPGVATRRRVVSPGRAAAFGRLSLLGHEPIAFAAWARLGTGARTGGGARRDPEPSRRRDGAGRRVGVDR